MRRKIGRILVPVMAAMLVFGGCGNTTVVTDRVTENQTHKAENESNEPAEKEPAEDEDELNEENQEEQDKQDSEEDADEEKAEIPEESSLNIDYTSVDGLRMEKGSRISAVIKNTDSDYWKAAKKGLSLIHI